MAIATPNGERLTYELFRAFLFRYLERFFCLDESTFLFKAFRLFHLLLLYYDPQLAYHLHDLDFVPELYSPQWFLTLYARALPIPQVLRLWDMMIAVDDPSFTFFIGLCMIRKQRTALLLGDVSNIPEVISNIQFKHEDEIDETVAEALKLYQMTPRCILRHLRLCCVATVELTPIPQLTIQEGNGGLSSPSKAYANQTTSMKLNIEEHDHQLSLQTVRNSMAITAQELVDSMLPSNLHHNNNNSKYHDEFTSPSSSAYIPQQYVIIDIRSYEDSVASGGGILPRAIQLEPEFLNRPDAFEVWLQHFDGTRGCNICIVDLPPVQWTGVALWRRLLLGEGDGLNKFRGRYEFDDVHENKRKLDALLAGVMGDKSASRSLDQQRVDSQSKHAKDEEQALATDLTRPAMLLAIALQRHSFPHVSVLEGGFPALVEQLMTTRGSVEPIIINHDNDTWTNFLKKTGRLSETNKTGKKQQVKKFFNDNAENTKDEKQIRSEKDLTELERLELAAKLAEKLNHTYVLDILKERIESANLVKAEHK